MPRVLFALKAYGNSFVHVPYLLARHGIEVEAVTAKDNPLRFSKWVRRFFFAAGDDPAFSSMVCERLSTGGYNLLVIGDEPALRAIYSNPAHAGFAALLPLPPGGALASMVGKKNLFYKFCEQHGIPIPRTEYVSSFAETEAAGARIGWPCVIKRSTGSGGKNSVFICRDLQELRATFDRLRDDSEWMVQEFVEGATGVAMFSSFRGQLYAWSALSKKVCLAGGLGPKVISEFMADFRIEAICERFARHGGIQGATAFDFLQRANGEVLAIDPHFGRSSTTFHFGLSAGVDFGRAIKDGIENRPSRQAPNPATGILVKYPEIIDLAFQIGFRRALAEAPLFRKNVRYYFAPPGDWRMAIALGADALKSNLRITLGGLRRSILGRRQPVAAPAQSVLSSE